MDMSFQKEHIDCFVICSGDSDFSPLVSKLKENNKYVIGLGVKNSTSDLLIENCDEFIFYEDIVRVQERPRPAISRNLPAKLQDCFGLLSDSVLALQRENKEILWGSMVKETMKRKKPSFNEGYFGFRTFSHLLEDAQKRGIVKLRRDQRSGSYIIEDLGEAAPTEAGSSAPAASAEASTEASAGADADAAKTPSRRRRSRGSRRARSTGATPAGADNGAVADRADGGEDEADVPASSPAPPREASRAASSAASAGAPERGGSFSLFSWLRRDPEEGGTEKTKKP
jgi:hypothetical protein